MKSRITAALAIAALMMFYVPAAIAQEIHKDASTSGTTGLFSVPLAAVMGQGEFSATAFFGTTSMQPGDSKIENSGIGGAFAFGAAPGLEIYGMFAPRVGVHRNYTVEKARGLTGAEAPRLDNHPFAIDRWSEGVGDLSIGIKYRVYGEPGLFDGMAVIAEVKLPTSNTDAGIGTGKVDFSIGFVASAEISEMVGISSYLGGTFRSSPDLIALGNEFNYGVGVQIPTRFWVSAILEATGAIVANPDAPAQPIVGAGFVSGYDPVLLSIGARFSHDMGVALDLAYVYNANVQAPEGLGNLDLRKDGMLAKLSYTNSRREPVILVGAAPMALPPVNRPPTLNCRAERNSVRVGESVRLFADVNDPDGDDLTVSWDTQAGSINPRTGEQVTWSSQGVRPGSGPVTARVSDGYGGTADCSLTITVTAAPPPPQPTILTFSCAEFPSGNTRIDNRCKAILDDVALQLRQNPRATAVITGHSDSAGSDDVNNTMSQERADNAEAFLMETHGIAGNRIDTAAGGSGTPVGDNSTAEGRLQNRRIVVVITIPAQ